MLDLSAVQRLNREFRVTDQAWPLYAPALGEPHLVEDILLYVDDVVAHICAFPLGDARRELSPVDIRRVVEAVTTDNLCVINVWGRFSTTPARLAVHERPFDLTQFFDYGPRRVDLAIPVNLASLDDDLKLRRVVSKIRRSALDVEIAARAHLSAEHLVLIRDMLGSHDVIPFDTALILSIPALIRDPNTVVVDVRSDGKLKAFSVLWLPAADRAVSAWAFSRHEVGGRYGDTAMEASIRLCAAEGKRYLHLGYSENEGIWRFKKKWGASIHGPEYREAVYVARDRPLLPPLDRWFTWRERFVMQKEVTTG